MCRIPAAFLSSRAETMGNRPKVGTTKLLSSWLRKVDHGFAGVDTSLFTSHQLSLGAPCSHQRTWDNQDGAKPHQSSVFFSFPSPPMIGCPILRVLGEGWDKQNLRGRASGAEPWYPTLRQQREGWATRSWVVADGEFLLREPPAVH